MNKKYLKYLIVGLILLLAIFVDAQCPMCRMSAESNLANGGTEGKGLNNGILYLLSLPYLLILTLGIIYYRHKKQIKEEH